ncbi:MAG: hypothetical protein SAK29_08830 [Scytonema sp. PMC 1069.18]|nr:hypothetical protein [Scytonema sp. PMC 1069.18]MEC4884806.1 hypothetical protein [Scytonema sp. PMC 1070.18]
MQLSTGGGKTVIFAAIAHEFTSTCLGVLVFAHEKNCFFKQQTSWQRRLEYNRVLLKSPTNLLILSSGVAGI